MGWRRRLGAVGAGLQGQARGELLGLEGDDGRPATGEY